MSVAEVELIVEIHSVEHDALGVGVAKLQRKALRQAVLYLHEQRVVVILRRADEFLDLAELRTDAAVGKQAAIHIRQDDGPTAARPGEWAGGAEDVSRRASQRFQVRVIGGARNYVYAVIPHGADG